jgi:tetratricopeptide (TPR) repeat protein
MWSENYDRDLESIFELQDEITVNLIMAMKVNLTYGEQGRLWSCMYKPNIRAYEKFLLASEYRDKFTKQDNAQSIRFAEEAIILDKNFAFAYVSLGFGHYIEIMSGWSMDPIFSYKEVERCVEKALVLSDTFDYAHLLLAHFYLLKHQHDNAIEECKKALELNPNGADAHAHLGIFHIYSGEPEEAVKFIKKAFRLNPIPPSWYYGNIAAAYSMMGEYDEAIRVADKSISLAPDFLIPHVVLAGTFAVLENELKADDAVQNLLRIDPTFSLDTVRMFPFKNELDMQSII